MNVIKPLRQFYALAIMLGLAMRLILTSAVTTKATIRGATLLTVVFSALVVQAEPIARDSFAVSAGGNDYDPFMPIFDQDATVGAPGFIGPWGISFTRHPVPIPGGLTHPLTPGETFGGQIVSFTEDDSVGGGNARNLSREIAYTPETRTYYMSLLLNKNAPTDRVDLLAGLGRAQLAETGIFSIEGAWIGHVDGAIWFFWGPGASFDVLLPRAEMSVDETYFALLEIDYSTSGSDTVTATIFDGSSSEVAGEEYPGLDLDESMGRFSVFTQDFGPASSVDEWRFGTELRDVMVPEPSTSSLLIGLAALGILTKRKKRVI